MTTSNPFATKPETQVFLLSLSNELCNEILDNVAENYGITKEEAYQEITDPDAENLMDYITGEKRAAIHLVYKKFQLNQIQNA